MADSTGSHAPRSPFRAWRAFLWSMQGLRATWAIESSFRLEVYLFVLLIVELLNTGIEVVVDRIGLERHALSGFAKDLGSAAVLLGLLLVAVTWLLVLFG